MTRLERIFASLRERGESALVTYFMAGYPDEASSLELIDACARGGADIIEIGMPFSDPSADGPTIQAAAMQSLKSGTKTATVFRIAEQLRARTDAGIVLMGYLNPVLAYGEERFLDECARIGIDGLILPDLPPEEAEDFCRKAQARGVAVVFLLAPTSTPERCEKVFRAASGFIYFVSVTGVTGARTELPADLGERLDSLRARSPVPVVVGFGVSTPEQAASLGKHADGVVVGSALVTKAGGNDPIAERVQRVETLAHQLKAALRG